MMRSAARPLLRASAVLTLVALAACGGGGGDGDPPPGALGTLAYVETECRDTKEGFVERQALRIRQGEGAPVTVFETPGVGPLFPGGVGGLCQGLTQGRLGEAAIAREAFQSVQVSPDGASVVFEVTDEFSSNPYLPLNLPPQQKGIFWVRADGTGLRRLGPPSRERFFYLQNGGFFYVSFLVFSPTGQTIAFVDKGADADGHDADQIVTIDVSTGARRQVTHLPPAVPPSTVPADAPTIWFPLFIDERTISFYASANPDGLNPEGALLPMTIKTDGSHLEVPLPIAVPLRGSTVELRFVITGDRPQALFVVVPGTPINPSNLPQEIREIFVIDEDKHILQLTTFRRADTTNSLVDVDREHVYFSASADPLGSNPSGNCQVFSIDRLGSDLRQLTNFRESEHSRLGCLWGRFGLGCAAWVLVQDSQSRTLLLTSDCDPLGTNPKGAQIFAMQPDGSGLRQLTNSSGLVREADGTYSSELPGPVAYGPYVP